MERRARALQLKIRFTAAASRGDYDAANTMLGEYLGEHRDYLTNIGHALEAMEKLAPEWVLEELRHAKPYYRVKLRYTGNGNPSAPIWKSRFVCKSAEAAMIVASLRFHLVLLDKRIERAKLGVDENWESL